jgi:hypothetical protein
MGKIICDDCIHNVNRLHCSWQVNVFPYATRCNHFKGDGMSSNVVEIPIKQVPAILDTKALPEPEVTVEGTIFSNSEPEKSIYYSKLP